MPYLSRAARLAPAAAIVLLPLLTAAPPVVHAQTASDFAPVTDAMLEDPAPGDWLTWRRTPNGWGFRHGCTTTCCE